VPAVTTPFDEQGALDLPAARTLFEWMAEQGMHGLVVAGTTGEWFSLAAEEKRALFRAAGEVLAGVMPPIAGCNAFTAEEVIRKAEMSVDAGFDSILLMPPPYIRPCERDSVGFYEDMNVGTPLPVCVYNWPPEVDIVRHTLETTGYL
jgi:4-hydroxy-tetrahydrodipicolinate synthase